MSTYRAKQSTCSFIGDSSVELSIAKRPLSFSFIIKLGFRSERMDLVIRCIALKKVSETVELIAQIPYDLTRVL
jgi:hypothetical protein